MKTFPNTFLKYSALLVACSVAVSTSSFAKDYAVNSPESFKKAVKHLQPGDNIILANKVWQDFEMVFKGSGTEQKPITLKAETSGKVILSGQSNLRLAGQYLVVKGLVFKDGYSPTGEVISFRRNKDDLAYHSRVTEVVIDKYNNPDKFDDDKWVVLYGKYNRFDHNHLEGKSNKGVTMAVRLNTEASQQNHHHIDHNYFGPRPILGSNGGETLRIGTSHYSLTQSNTLVENNYFDRCDGEVEIISNKSGSNIYRNNTFFESRGTLTLRHGSKNLVENNVFFGNNADHTGGIRVINENQTVRNNYLSGLTGYRFGSGLTIMNGVPNSPINRYNQVDNANIHHNSFINVEHIQLAAGSDKERSAAPKNSVIANNLFYNENHQNSFELFDDISGIRFVDNALNNVEKPAISTGFINSPIKLAQHANGLFYPVGEQYENIGASRDLVVTQKDQTGVSWYPKAKPVIAFNSGKTIHTAATVDALVNAVNSASNGDIIQLAPGNIDLTKIIAVNKVLTIKGAENGKTILLPNRATTFSILDNGALQLENVIVDGKQAPDSTGNALIRTTKIPMLINYRLNLINVNVNNLNVNHAYNVLDVAKSSMANEITIKNSQFNNVTGDILKLNKETDDLGIYNAEYVTLENNQFSNVKGAVVELYRGGSDESTFGPHLLVKNNRFENVGFGKKNKSQASLLIHGVQVTVVDHNEFINSQPIVLNHTVGEPKSTISNNTFNQTAEPVIKELNAKTFNGKHTAVLTGNKFSAQ
jgi:poly(beta-D-mannuronate) lyase